MSASGPALAGKLTWTSVLGAAFLMATSAVGPGFLTQTTVFTATLGASFGFVILASVLFDLAAQLTIWRVIAVSRRRAQDVADLLLPGLGAFLGSVIVLGGLAFNVGNIAGTGLGLSAMLGMEPRLGAGLSALVAISLFLSRDAGRAMDRFAQVLGLVLMGLMVHVAVTASPPVGEAALRTVWPERMDALAVVTLVGGTVGGYITFAGGHRLLDAGVHGLEALPAVQRSALSGIGLASVVRVTLFLAALAVAARVELAGAENPPAAVFAAAIGELGLRLFGLVMWSAAITSVVGASYTSITFLSSMSGVVGRHPRAAIILFTLASTAIFLVVGQPVRLLILAGALNGLVLPLSLGVMLVAAYRRDIVGEYRHPWWLAVAGALTALLMAALGAYTLVTQLPRLLG